MEYYLCIGVNELCGVGQFDRVGHSMTLAEFRGQGLFPSSGFIKRRPEQSPGNHTHTFICCKINIFKGEKDTSVTKGRVEKTNLLYDFSDIWLHGFF